MLAGCLLSLSAGEGLAAGETVIHSLPLPPRSEPTSSGRTVSVVARLAPVEIRDVGVDVASSPRPLDAGVAGPRDVRAEPTRDASSLLVDAPIAPLPALARFEVLTVRKGQSLYSMFSEHHLRHGDLMQILDTDSEVKRRLSQLRPGQIIHVNTDAERRVLHLVVAANSERPLLVSRGSWSFIVSATSDALSALERSTSRQPAAMDAAKPDVTRPSSALIEDARVSDDSAASFDRAASAAATVNTQTHMANLQLRSGQSLYELFIERQLSRVDLLAMLQSDPQTRRRLSRLQAGQSLRVEHDGHGGVLSLTLIAPGPTDLHIARDGSRYVASSIPDAPVEQTSRDTSQDGTVKQPDELVSEASLDSDDVVGEVANNGSEYSFVSLPSPVVQHEVEVSRGDSLYLLFNRLDIPASEIAGLLAQPEGKALRRLRPGQLVSLALLADNRIHTLETDVDETRTLKARRTGADTLEVIIEDNPLERRIVTASGIVEDSLFVDGQRAGLSDRVIMQLVEIFGWDVDFALDVRSGDRFSVIYESLYRDGERKRDGNILAAEFVNHGRALRGLRYTDDTGASAYFAPDGFSMRKAFLRTPVKFSRISSRFSSGRMHPVLNRIRAHKGVDYAAPRGTPIMAAGNGRVTFSGWRNGYGRTVVIQHGATYSTLYGHMSRIHARARKGQRVRQGETIGYVGSTGLATGPHLHYEFRVSGVHKDPLRVKLPKALPIEERYRLDFIQKSRELMAALDLLSSANQTASAQSTPGVTDN